MARRPTSNAQPQTEGLGHNSSGPLTADETAALSQYYSLKIRAQQNEADQAKAVYDGKREQVNGLFALVKGDLHYSRKEFEEVLALQNMGAGEFLAYEAKRHGRLAAGGLPVGVQQELALGDTADDKAHAYNDGYRVGHRAGDPVCPDHIASILRADWEHGWSDAQSDNIAKIKVAESVLAARAKKSGEMVEEVPEPEPERELTRAELKAQERKAKKGLDALGAIAEAEPELVAQAKEDHPEWSEPTPGETEFVN